MRLRATAAAAALALTCACAKTTQWSAQDFADRATKYADEGRYEAAAIEYRNAIKREPQWADAHAKLAEMLTALGSFDGAYRAYREACTLNPSDARSCLQTARLLLAAGLTSEAEYRAQTVLDRNPANVEAHLVLASVYAKLGRMSHALRLLNKAVAIDHRADAYAALGDVHLANGDRASAETAFRTAVDRSQGSPEARINLARFLVDSDRTAEAEAELVEALRSNPNHELANRALAALYMRTDRADSAEAYLERAAAQPNQQYRSLLALADFYCAAQRWEEARAVLKRAPREGAVAMAAKVRLAAMDYETGEVDTAHHTLDAVLKQRPTAEAWTLQAQFLAREHRLDEALDAAHAAIGIQPGMPEAYSIIAAVERQRGQQDPAAVLDEQNRPQDDRDRR